MELTCSFATGMNFKHTGMGISVAVPVNSSRPVCASRRKVVTVLESWLAASR